MKIHLPNGKTITIEGTKWVALEFHNKAEKEQVAACLETPANLIGVFGDGVSDPGTQRALDKVEKKICARVKAAEGKKA